MLLPCLAVLVVAGGVGVRAEWPCPIDNEIYPCVCKADEYYNLTMNCSDIRSTAQLDIIFNGVIFPFVKFHKLIIDHDPNDNNNQLTAINAHTFGEVSFEEIHIHGTKLDTIADEAFVASHETLIYYDISNNYMQNFPFEALPDYVKLLELNLNNNRFLELPMIQSMTLKKLTANNNPNMALVYSPIGIEQFSLAPMLQEISLSDIGLTGTIPTRLFDELAYLERLDLSYNFLQVLDVNRIKTKNRTLNFVDLSNNEIERVYHDAFVGLKSGGYLSMRNNKILTLEQEDWEHIFLQLRDDGIIDLMGNDLLCGCDMAWIFEDTTCVYLNMITDTTQCYTGEQLIFFNPDLLCAQCPTFTCDYCDIYAPLLRMSAKRAADSHRKAQLSIQQSSATKQ